MRSPNQTLNRLRHPNVLPLLASRRCYLGNLGLYADGTSKSPGSMMDQGEMMGQGDMMQGGQKMGGDGTE